MADSIRPPSCNALVWSKAGDHVCGQQVGVRTWNDFTGALHRACPRHVGPMLRRYPEYLPERLPTAGELQLGSPWARGAFGPGDRIEVANLIPKGWRMVVTCTPNRLFNVRAYDEHNTERAEWRNRHDGLQAARQFALFMQNLTLDPPEPEWLPESADPLTAAKAEAERVA